MQKVILYIHGKGGSHAEVEQYKKYCSDFDMIGVDYHEDLPWIVQPQITAVYEQVKKKYDHIYVLANSIGAYFAMYTLQHFNIKKAWFISPILDMEKLILDMMGWANVSEQDLFEKKEIRTTFNETLSWKYLCFVRENPITWHIPTEILYAKQDHLTSQETVDAFLCTHPAKLTIMDNGEHWFHTNEQLAFLHTWLKHVIHAI